MMKPFTNNNNNNKQHKREEIRQHSMAMAGDFFCMVASPHHHQLHVIIFKWQFRRNLDHNTDEKHWPPDAILRTPSNFVQCNRRKQQTANKRRKKKCSRGHTTQKINGFIINLSLIFVSMLSFFFFVSNWNCSTCFGTRTVHGTPNTYTVDIYILRQTQTPYERTIKIQCIRQFFNSHRWSAKNYTYKMPYCVFENTRQCLL